MNSSYKRSDLVLISITVIFGAIALILACTGVSTSNWQVTLANTSSGQMYIANTANFFYACRLNSVGEVLSCEQRSKNSNILSYYIITTKGNQTELNLVIK